MKKLLLIIALTLTANAYNGKICDMYIASYDKNFNKGNIEFDYGSKSLAKIYFIAALKSIQDAKASCGASSSIKKSLSGIDKTIRTYLELIAITSGAK